MGLQPHRSGTQPARTPDSLLAVFDIPQPFTMVYKFLCLIMLAVTPSVLGKSMKISEPKLLENQVYGRPWYCFFVPEKPECQEKPEEGRQLGDLDALFDVPSAESEREFDMPAPFGGSEAAQEHQIRDVHQDNFLETLKAAVREFEDKREVMKMLPLSAKEKADKTQAPPRKVNTCVYCDARCVARAEASQYASAQDYFDVAITELNKIVQGGLDENMVVGLTLVLLPGKVTEMSWFFDYSAKSSLELLTAINRKFWVETGLYKMASDRVGCDLDFLVAAPEDPAWKYMGSIEGIANMFQLCLASYSTVQMSASPIRLAKLMGHEFGHMLGIYHDGSVNSAYTSMASHFEPGQMFGDCKAELEDLNATCTSSSVGCPSGKCIMAATVDGTEWSDCSRAYYSMYNCLVGAAPSYYSDTCVNV